MTCNYGTFPTPLDLPPIFSFVLSPKGEMPKAEGAKIAPKIALIKTSEKPKFFKLTIIFLKNVRKSLW